MARRTRVELVDDLDGKVLSDSDGETVSFGLDGVAYEIDLGKRNADKLRAALRDYISAGRKTGSSRSRRGSTAATSRDYDPKAVRKWAASNKVDVPTRGRIPRDVLERYRAEGN